MNTSTVTKIDAPAPTASHGFIDSSVLPVLSIAPHDGVGGCVPSPRKLSAASVSTAVANVSVNCTITTGNRFGMTARAMMCTGPPPRTRAASTNSRSRSDAVIALT